MFAKIAAAVGTEGRNHLIRDSFALVAFILLDNPLIPVHCL